MTLIHKHHIIPRHAGGTDDHSNIMELTIEEHAEAHRVLWETHGRPEDKLAWQCLAGLIDRAEMITELCRIAGRKGGAIGGRKGKGRKQSQDWINKRKMVGERNGMYGKKHSEERKQIISEQVKERIQNSDGEWIGSINLKESTKKRFADGSHPSCKTWTCEHCGKSGKAMGNYYKYHHINCKEYIQPDLSSPYSKREFC